MNEKIKVLVAEDNASLLKRYVKIIETEENLNLVAAVSNGYEAVMNAALYKPDIILMDIEMETRDAGIIATEQIMKALPLTKIIILTVYETEEFIFKAFTNGVIDYIYKNVNRTELIRSINDVYNNCVAIRPEIAEKIRKEFSVVKKRQDSLLYFINLVHSLTRAELEILQLLMQGMTRNEICDLRHVGISTIKTQIHNILHKLEMKSTEDVVVMINDSGLAEWIDKMAQNKTD